MNDLHKLDFIELTEKKNMHNSKNEKKGLKVLINFL